MTRNLVYVTSYHDFAERGGPSVAEYLFFHGFEFGKRYHLPLLTDRFVIPSGDPMIRTDRKIDFQSRQVMPDGLFVQNASTLASIERALGSQSESFGDERIARSLREDGLLLSAPSGAVFYAPERARPDVVDSFSSLGDPARRLRVGSSTTKIVPASIVVCRAMFAHSPAWTVGGLVCTVQWFERWRECFQRDQVYIEYIEL
jgi:hypothetical protein